MHQQFDHMCVRGVMVNKIAEENYMVARERSIKANYYMDVVVVVST